MLVIILGMSDWILKKNIITNFCLLLIFYENCTNLSNSGGPLELSLGHSLGPQVGEHWYRIRNGVAMVIFLLQIRWSCCWSQKSFAEMYLTLSRLLWIQILKVKNVPTPITLFYVQVRFFIDCINGFIKRGPLHTVTSNCKYLICSDDFCSSFIITLVTSAFSWSCGKIPSEKPGRNQMWLDLWEILKNWYSVLYDLADSEL